MYGIAYWIIYRHILWDSNQTKSKINFLYQSYVSDIMLLAFLLKCITWWWAGWHKKIALTLLLLKRDYWNQNSPDHQGPHYSGIIGTRIAQAINDHIIGSARSTDLLLCETSSTTSTISVLTKWYNVTYFMCSERRLASGKSTIYHKWANKSLHAQNNFPGEYVSVDTLRGVGIFITPRT